MPWNLAYTDNLNRGSYSPGYSIGANQRFWLWRCEGPPEGFVRRYGTLRLLTFETVEGRFVTCQRQSWQMWLSTTAVDLGGSLPGYLFQFKVSEKGPEFGTYKLYYFS